MQSDAWLSGVCARSEERSYVEKLSSGHDTHAGQAAAWQVFGQHVVTAKAGNQQHAFFDQATLNQGGIAYAVLTPARTHNTINGNLGGMGASEEDLDQPGQHGMHDMGAVALGHCCSLLSCNSIPCPQMPACSQTP